MKKVIISIAMLTISIMCYSQTTPKQTPSGAVFSPVFQEIKDKQAASKFPNLEETKKCLTIMLQAEENRVELSKSSTHRGGSNQPMPTIVRPRVIIHYIQILRPF